MLNKFVKTKSVVYCKEIIYDLGKCMSGKASGNYWLDAVNTCKCEKYFAASKYVKVNVVTQFWWFSHRFFYSIKLMG